RAAVPRAGDDRLGIGEPADRHRLVPGLPGLVADLTVGVAAPAHDRAGRQDRTQVIVAAGQRDRVGQPSDCDRPRAARDIGPGPELPALVAAPADDGAGPSPGAAVRATERELDRVIDADD